MSQKRLSSEFGYCYASLQVLTIVIRMTVSEEEGREEGKRGRGEVGRWEGGERRREK